MSNLMLAQFNQFLSQSCVELQISESNLFSSHHSALKDQDTLNLFVMNIFEQLSFTFTSQRSQVKPLSKEQLFTIYKEMRELESSMHCTLQDILADKSTLR